MLTSNKATKTNNTKKRLTFAETQQASKGSKRGKTWQRTNKRDQWVTLDA